MSKLYIFNILWQVTVFYDMQSKFQNKVLLPKKYNSPEHMFSSNSRIRTSTNLDKGSLPISAVLLYFF
jgi:hypothetical protein